MLNYKDLLWDMNCLGTNIDVDFGNDFLFTMFALRLALMYCVNKYTKFVYKQYSCIELILTKFHCHLSICTYKFMHLLSAINKYYS